MPGAAIPAIAEGEIPGFGHTKAAPSPLPCSFKQQPEASSASSSQKKRGRAKKKKELFGMRTISPLPQLAPMIWKGFPWRIPAQGRGWRWLEVLI